MSWKVFPVRNVEFTGYRETVSDTRIARYRRVNQKNKQFFQVVLAKTPFYAESGGQVGDTGYLESEGQRVRVSDTRKENNLIVHILEELPAHVEAPVKAVNPPETSAAWAPWAFIVASSTSPRRQ